MTEKSEQRGSNDDRHMVFCEDRGEDEYPRYTIFIHEADVMMIAAAGEVESGKLTPAEARKLLEPYREVLGAIFTGNQLPIIEPHRMKWSDPDFFPNAGAVWESPQGSQIFSYKAYDLGIEGVFLEWSIAGPVFSVEDEEALNELKEAVSGEYKIVVKQDNNAYDSLGESVEWARELIEDAVSTVEAPHTQATQMNYASSTSEQAATTAVFGDLVYGDGGRGLVFLEEDYIAELRDFRDALQSAADWGELRDMVSGERYQETVEVWKGYENASPPNPADDFDIETFPAYVDGDFPEFAPAVMGRWVDKGIIDEYGWHLPTMDGYHPVIDFENEEVVVSLLEEQGYICIRDDTRIWNAIWRG